MPVFNHSDVFVLDNGGNTLKAGFSNQPSCRVIPNCITKAKSEKRRAFIADQVNDHDDYINRLITISVDFLSLPMKLHTTKTSEHIKVAFFRATKLCLRQCFQPWFRGTRRFFLFITRLREHPQIHYFEYQSSAKH